MAGTALALADATPALTHAEAPSLPQSEVVAEMVHELRNVLAAVTYQVELLQLEVPGLPGGRAELILKSVDTGAQVLLRLQEAARQEPEQPALVDLRQVLEDVAELTRFRWDRLAGDTRPPVTVHLDLAQVPPVRGHEGEFIQVFTNLVINACEALTGGGNVRLTTRYDGNHVLATVQDDGPGMTPETRQSLFQRHYTTKHGDNSGLGLSIVAEIVRRHGGHVLVRSEPGRGTTFYISMHPEPGAGQLHTAAALRVLLVEDDPSIRGCLQQFLVLAGHEVRVADCAVMAMELMEETFDLLLTDLNLGSGPDGFAVARAARERHPGAKVVVVTGWHEGVAPPEVDLLLHKPIKGQQLLAVVQHLTSGQVPAEFEGRIVATK